MSFRKITVKSGNEEFTMDVTEEEYQRYYRPWWRMKKKEQRNREAMEKNGYTALVNKNWTLKLYFFTYNLPLLYSRICFPVLPGCKISQRICRPFFVEKFYICGHFFLNIFSP